VTFVGAVDDVETWLKKSKVFVLTSESEGPPSALMKVMMCGLPAVVADVGDLVEDGVNGYLVAPRTPGQFADRIVHLLRDELRRLDLSRAARKAALANDMRRVAGQWETILSAEGGWEKA
jgi:L-malate glycosyltransferase